MMPTPLPKSLTDTLKAGEQVYDCCEAFTEEIHKLWPIWVEKVRPVAGKFSSPHMMIAVNLLSLAMMSMLAAQVSEPDIMASIDTIFDLYTDEKIVLKLRDMPDDKPAIMRFLSDLLAENAQRLANARKIG